MEVIYTPPWQSIEAVVNIAVQEDIELIGVSTLATDHLIVPQLMAALGDAGLGDVGVVVGGIVPESEHDPLLAAGVDTIFGPGTTRDEIVSCALALVTRTRAARGASS
jgi:methylmalonyl-CoA mutase C-terminal domain/subunit